MDFDVTYRDIGEFGCQQRKYAIVIFLFNTYGAWLMLQYSFVAYSLPFTCLGYDQDTPFRDMCPDNSITRCQTLTFDTLLESTVVSEWKLVCDKAHFAPMVMSVFMGGVLIGALFMGILADCIGRRKTLMICIIGIIIVNYASSITKHFNLYLLLRFIVGLFCSGQILASFVLLNELVGSSTRGAIGTILQLFFAIGIMCFAIVAKFVPHWQALTSLTSIIGLPLGLSLLLLPESPRWLYANGNRQEAIQVLKRIAQGNGTQLNMRHVQKGDSTAASEAPSSIGLMSLVTHPALRAMTFIQVVSWFVNSMTYYGLTIAAAGTGDRYTSTFMSGFVEIFAYIGTILFLPKLGRRTTLCAFMIGGGTSLLFLLLLPDWEWLVYWVAMLSKTCIAGSFAVAYIHSAEIFPTCIRNSAMGLVSMAARAGGMASPFVAQVRSDWVPNLHLVLFGVVTVGSGIWNMCLPETADLPLPDTVEDLVMRLRPSSLHSRRDNLTYDPLPKKDFHEENIDV